MADPLSLAAGAAGLLSLGISVCHGLLEYYESYRHSGAALENMYTQLLALNKTLALVESVTSKPERPWDASIKARVEESIESCRVAIQALDKKLTKLKTSITHGSNLGDRVKSFTHKASFPFRESTLVRLKEIVIELRGDLSLVMNVLQL